MKDDLVGRVVGLSQFLKMVPVDPRHPDGEQRRMDRTKWVRVTSVCRNDPKLVNAQNIHTGECSIERMETMHTFMTKAY